MWEAFAAHVQDRRIGVELNHRVTSIIHSGDRVHRIAVNADGVSKEYEVDAVLSSIPLSDLVLALRPASPDHVLDAARRLKYRDLCVVVLILDGDAPFRDNWVYVHDPTTQAGRVQNFGAWSESMVRPGTTCLGVEYFCFAGDAIWELPSEEAIALAAHELARIGLIDSSRVIDGLKIQVPKAYPVYDQSFHGDLEVLRAYLAGFENLQTCGRNGLHRYNNQDHSMWTAILATLNLATDADYDVWTVNTEAEYLEEGKAVEAALARQVMAAFG
jgi:protoporphyrinogen oxidase